jgi:hypothetical protein
MKQFFTKRKFLLYNILFLSACVAPDPTRELSPEDKDVYITNRDQSVSFADYQTYAIVDSVMLVSRSEGDSVKSTFGDEIISDINLEMQKYGFVLVGKSQTPDVGVNVSVLNFFEKAPDTYYEYANANSGFLRYPAPGYWGHLDYQYLFPTNFGYEEIEAGSIAIEMVDLKNAGAGGSQKFNVIWSTLISGNIVDSTHTNPTRLASAIANSFNQSPYLKEGK